MRLLEVVRAIGWVVGLASGVLLMLFRAVMVMKQFGGLLESDDAAVMRAQKTLAFWTWVLIAVALGGLGLFYLTEGCAQAAQPPPPPGATSAGRALPVEGGSRRRPAPTEGLSWA